MHLHNSPPHLPVIGNNKVETTFLRLFLPVVPVVSKSKHARAKNADAPVMCLRCQALLGGAVALYNRQLSVALVSGNRDRVGEVDASGVFARHRNTEKRIRVALVEALRQSGRLIAEH